MWRQNRVADHPNNRAPSDSSRSKQYPLLDMYRADILGLRVRCSQRRSRQSSYNMIPGKYWDGHSKIINDDDHKWFRYVPAIH
jgi:hypothetical protein